MAVVWGLQPVLMPAVRKPGDDRIGVAIAAAFAAGAVAAGALVVVLAGHPIEGGEHLPTIRLLRVGEGGRAVEP
jgi:pyruvate kinase